MILITFMGLIFKDFCTLDCLFNWSEQVKVSDWNTAVTSKDKTVLEKSKKLNEVPSPESSFSNTLDI